MRRTLAILSFILTLGLSGQGQGVFNIPSDTLLQGCIPDSVDLFLFADSLKSNAFTYDTIPYYTIPSGGTTVNMSDDQVLGPFPVGFDVSWFCGEYNTFYLCSNGWIGFQNTTNAFTPNPIPSTAFNVPKNAVLGVWRDWNPAVGVGPYITYQTLGTAPQRKLVVTWSAVPMFSCTSLQGTFQIVVHETSNIIHTNITTMPVCFAWVGGDGVHGIHDPTGTYGLAVAGRNDTPFTTNNESLRFIPDSPVTWTAAIDGPLGIGNELSASFTQSQWVYATGQQCDNDSVTDSVYVSYSCIALEMDNGNVNCNGDSSGFAVAIDTSITSGTAAPYTFYWIDDLGDTIATHPSSNNIDTLFNLPAGSYTCYAFDNTGQFAVGQTTISEPPLLTSSISNPTMVSCPDGLNCDASAEADGIGGTPPYSYTWSSGEPFKVANQLCPDSNFVTVTDVYGCTSVSSVVIAVPDTIETTGFGDTLICITNPAAIVAASTGGTPPFSYVWTEGSLTGQVVATSGNTVVSPEINTPYFVSSIDANGCPGDTSKVMIKVRPPLSSQIMAEDTICPYDTIDITIEGFGGDSIYTFSWSSGSFGDVVTVSPDLSTWYIVTVSDQCGTPSYKDSVFVQVGGYSKIQANIELEDDSICSGENVYLIANGTGGFRGPDEYRYAWSAANMDGKPIQFARPTQTTIYTLTITDLCLSPEGIAEKTVYVGNPYTPPFMANPPESCSGTEVIISFAQTQRGYQYDWDFGDGNILENLFSDTVFHEYNAPGCYDVTLSTITDFGCRSERTERCLINILQAPDAAFHHFPEHPNTLDPFVKFEDNSIKAESIVWYLDQDTLSLDSLFVHEFTDTGNYVVSLVAFSTDGCVDTTMVSLMHFAEQTLYIPSSFTPNGDQINDVFKIRGEGLSKDRFELIIYDRWGNRLFKSTNPDYGWDGRMLQNGGEIVPTGSYPYTLQYVDRTETVRKLRGQIIVSSSGTYRGIR